MKAKIALVFLGFAALTSLHSTNSYVLKTVKASGGDYTLSQLQTALDDARAYQNGTNCIPYIIEIAAGSTITGQFTFNAKACQQYVKVRSSDTSCLPQGRIDPETNSSQLACMVTIQSAANTSGQGNTMTTGAGKISYWEFEGLNITCAYPCALFNVVQMGTLFVAADQLTTITQPDHFWFHRCWIHGQLDDGPNQSLILAVSNSLVEDSRINLAQSAYSDSQGILIVNGHNISVRNNFISASAENVFTQYDSDNIEWVGNYVLKDIHYKWSNGLSTNPSGSCATGERYTKTVETYTAANNSVFSNNGSGGIRVTKNGHGYSTSDKVQVLKHSGALGSYGVWPITVIDANNFDLVGSTYYHAGSGNTTKVDPTNPTWECVAAAWATSANWGADWLVKDDWEVKGGSHIRTVGNRMENAWANAQYETAIINNVDYGFGVSDIEYSYNLNLNAASAFHAGNNNGVGFMHGISNLYVHDNLWPNLAAGTFQKTPFCIGVVVGLAAFPLSSGINNYLTNTRFEHNTSLMRSACGGSGYVIEADSTIAANNGQFKGAFNFNNNFLSLAPLSITVFGGSPFSAGQCALKSAVDTSKGGVYELSKNILSGIDTGTSSPTIEAAVCNTNNSYPLGTTFFNDTYSTKFADVSNGDVTLWDYHIKATYAAGYKAGTDGKDIGANIDQLNFWTASTVSGTRNPFFLMQVKPAIPGTTTATLPYTAPTTETCTPVVSVNSDYSSPAYNTADSGGNPARSASVTGLTTKTFYYEKVTCGAAAYVRETTFITN